VMVTGPESLVSQVARVAVTVKLLDAKSTISQSFAPTPIGTDGNEVKGVTVVPQMVLVELPIEQQLSYKTVAVTPRIVGSVALGYQLVGVMVEPTAVTVVGDPNALRDLNFVSTQPVNVNGAVADLTVNTDLDLPPSVSVVRQQGIVVRAYVSAAEGSQTMRIAPVIVGLPSDLSATLQPGTVQVTVTGPMPILGTLKAKDVRVEIDGSKLEPGTHLVTPTVTIPEVLQLVSVDPEKISVTVK
ncbi:MAG: hypothetical protein K6T56_06665, partial [Burkholderiales bacterium]|nr:hypothetical protein [Burkholderiales bacterium]